MILSEFAKRARFSLKARCFRTKTTSIAPAKYPTRLGRSVALTSGLLAHPRIFPSLPFSLQDRQEGLGQPSHKAGAAIIAAIPAPDLGVAFLGKVHAYTVGEAIVWAAALGSVCAARATLVARPLTSLAACAALSAGL